ncbi:MAG: arsenate reductase ArsC [Promethearchaeia archaeon]
MKRVLFLCTGNSARSQMAEALLKSIGDGKYEVMSAGTDIQSEVNPFVIEVLEEKGIETDGLHTKSVERFTEEPIDLVITVCDKAKQTCPAFPGAKAMEHWSLEDPATFEGTYEEILAKFRETRDEIEERIRKRLINPDPRIFGKMKLKL